MPLVKDKQELERQTRRKETREFFYGAKNNMWECSETNQGMLERLREIL